MNDQLQKEIFTRLDALAAKLGVAANYIMGLYYRQQIMNGWECLLGILPFVCFTVFFLLRIPKWQNADYRDGGGRVAGIWFIVVICLGIIVALAVNAIDFFGNPGYWAFRDIVRDIHQ